MESIDYIKIIEQLNFNNVWIEKRIQLEITIDQFIAILKGYQPNWDMRFGILFNNQDQYFYAYRSGFVLGKYRFEKNGSGGFCCTEMYSNNPEKNDYMVIFEIILEACSKYDVEMDYENFSAMRIETHRQNGLSDIQRF